jgi:hypothetical protein
MRRISLALLVLILGVVALSRGAMSPALAIDTSGGGAGPTTQPSSLDSRHKLDTHKRDTTVFDSDTPTSSHESANLTPAQVKELIGIIHEVDPDKGLRMENAFRENPDKVRQVLSPVFPKLMQLNNLKRRDPELYKLRLEDFRLNLATEDLAGQYRTATQAKDQAKADAVKEQLHTKLTEHFKLRQKIQEHELEALEHKIADLRTQIEARRASADQLIDDRFNQLVAKPIKPEW